MPGRGIQDLALNRIPAKWDPVWFGRFIREVMALGDARNSIGVGLDISGQPNEVATYSLSTDFLALLSQSFVVAQPSGFLNFERTLAGDEGVHVVDGGPNANITVKLIDVGVNLGKLQQVGAWAVLANPTNALGNVQSVQASVNGDVFTLQGGVLGFTNAPTWSADHTWLDNCAVRLGTGGDLNIEHNGTASFIENATGVLTIDSDAGVDILATAGVMNLTASGAVTIESTTGAMQLRAATSFKVRTNSVDRFEIDSAGAWLLAGNAGAAGQVPQSAGAGAPPVWATPSAGGAGGGGCYIFVQEATVTGSAATDLTVTGLNLSADEEYVIDLMIDNGSASTAVISMFFNGDTTATNYDRNLSTDGGAGTVVNNAVLANLAAGALVWYRLVMLPDFDGRPRTLVHGSSNNTSNTVFVTGQHMWRTVANVTSITFNSSVASAISVGSKVRIWKVLRTGGGAAAGGLWDFVGDFAVAGAAATDLTITGLNLDADEMYCVVANLSGAAAGAATLNIFFNGDTTATNYERELNGTAGDNSAIGGLDNGAPGQWVGYLRRCPVTGRVIWTAQGGRIITTAAISYSSVVIWDTNANLTSLTFNSSVASQIAIGSKVRVFKIKSTSSTAPTRVQSVQRNDFVITSNAAYADTDVTVALTSGEWLVTLDVMTTQNATPKIDVELSYTGTTTSVAGFQTRWRGAGTAFSESAITALPLTMSEITTDSVSRRLSMRLTVSTAGNLKLRAKQNTSSATAVTMHAGTNIQAVKVG